jgi:hypothetical protein
MLEELLELVICARLIEISSNRKEALFDKMNAPLSSLSAKIEMAFALGIISESAGLLCIWFAKYEINSRIVLRR